MTHDRAITFLKFACGFSIFMGVAVLLALATQSYGLFGWFMDLLHLPLDGAQSFGADSERVLGAISGGLLIDSNNWWPPRNTWPTGNTSISNR